MMPVNMILPVSSGEQVSVGLLAIALQNRGIDARSSLGWQLPLITDDVHGGARIERIETDLINARLDAGQVAVIAGLQGLARIPDRNPGGRLRYFGSGDCRGHWCRPL